jgi:hypothetical protein
MPPHEDWGTRILIRRARKLMGQVTYQRASTNPAAGQAADGCPGSGGARTLRGGDRAAITPIGTAFAHELHMTRVLRDLELALP